MIYSPNVHYDVVYKFLIFTLLLPITALADDYKFIDSAEFSMVVETEWAIATDDHNTEKLEVLIEPEADININQDWRLYALGRLRYDRENNINPDDNSHSELRELFVNTQVNNTAFTVGKQQIVWGKADGLKVLDVVNPQDFREFILDDFDRSRIPLWSLNMETELNNVTLQFIWIAEQKYHKFAKPGSTYALTSPLVVPALPANAQLTINPLKKPDNSFSNTDWGIRLSTFWQGWDLTLNYLYHFDDTPVLFRTLTTTNSGLQITLNPQYKRSHLFGGTFSNTFGALTLRGEIGYSTDQYRSINDSADIDGVIKTSELAYVIGLDWYGFEDSIISFQLFQTYLDNYTASAAGEELSSTATLLLKKNFLNETVTAEMLWLQDLDNNDGLLRPEITYVVNDEITLSAGLDVFYGSKTGLFGQFKKTDRLLVNLMIGF